MMLVSLQRSLASVALLSSCLVVAGCTHGGEGVSLEQSVAAPAPSRMMALAQPLEGRETRRRDRPIAYLPPAAGAVRTVRSREYADGVRQDVVLDGGASRTIQDGITVLARSDHRDTLDDRVPLFKPTEAAIRSEIGAAFPHVAMKVVERDSANAYGPYGLALGRIGETRCLYMWQWIDAARVPADAGVEGPLSVRVKLCRAGTTFDDMAALVDHLMIGGEPVVGVVDASGAVTPLTDEAMPERARAVHRKVRPIARHRAHAAHVARHDIDPGELIMPSTPIPMAEAVIPRPAAYPASDASGPKLSTDLPSQAYLGPNASKSR